MKLGDSQKAHHYLEEGLALARILDDKPTISFALNRMGYIEIEQSKFAAAQALLEEGMNLDQEQQDMRRIAQDLHMLGYVAYSRGDYATARHFAEQQLLLRRRLGIAAIPSR
jgi:tetratricopeptide (TPR) repeat protein